MLIVLTCNYLREYYLSIQNIGLAVAYLALYLLVCLSVLWTYWVIIVNPIPFDTGAQTPPHKVFRIKLGRYRICIYIYISAVSIHLAIKQTIVYTAWSLKGTRIPARPRFLPVLNVLLKTARVCTFSTLFARIRSWCIIWTRSTPTLSVRISAFQLCIQLFQLLLVFT